MIHLIFDNLTFNEEFKDFFKKSDFHPPLNKEYQTLAIIGCQSSGKSTLLNHIFSTDFEVMDESKGRGQTTQGIWSAVNKEFNTIIFDVEGTDAKERGRLIELFYLQAEEGKGITKAHINLALSKYFAKQANLEVQKIEKKVRR